MGKESGAYRVLVGKREGRRPLEKRKHRQEDNIKMDLKEVGWEHGLDRLDVERDFGGMLQMW